jgi:hypothetical protein
MNRARRGYPRPKTSHGSLPNGAVGVTTDHHPLPASPSLPSCRIMAHATHAAAQAVASRHRACVSRLRCVNTGNSDDSGQDSGLSEQTFTQQECSQPASHAKQEESPEYRDIFLFSPPQRNNLRRSTHIYTHPINREEMELNKVILLLI